VNRWGPWVLAAGGLVLTGAAGYHLQRAVALDRQIERKAAEQKQAQEAVRRGAAEAGNNPFGELFGLFAGFGGSPEIRALGAQEYHHRVRAWQLGGPGTAVAAAGLAWAWVVRRLGRAVPNNARRP
jgi:hypothetical protein